MVWGIFGVYNDNGEIINLIKKNALKMENFLNETYYLWLDKGNLHRIKYFHFARQTKKGDYIARIETDSTPPEAKIPKELEKMIKEYEIYK